MIRSNPFVGNGAYTKFMRAGYKLLVSREWFTYADIMAIKLGFKSASELPYTVCKCDHYGELKKAFPALISIVKNRVGEGCIESAGNIRNRQYRYVGEPNNPLEDLQNASIVKDIREYAQFCEDSAGFFPRAWLEYFFEDTMDLLRITRRKKNGGQRISSSLDRELTNIHLLPELYEAIRDNYVLHIDYEPYEEEVSSLLFHPHLLKEHNGRWFLFGHAEGKTPEFGYNLALDRIKSRPKVKSSIPYCQPPKGFYDLFFKDIVGVSHDEHAQPVDITIRAHNYKIYRLTETKKIHHSQETIKPFDEYVDGCYGCFKVHVEVNNEFIGRILQMGPGLEIMSPPEARSRFKGRIEMMYRLYEKNTEDDVPN